MRQAVLVFVGVTMFASVASMQTRKVDRSADEAAIRALANGPANNVKTTDDEIFWSGAYPTPLVKGKTQAPPAAQSRIAQRQNQKSTWEIVRLEVAEVGDMAYEFANFTLSFDLADTKEHVSFPGSALRVWKKVNGEWRAAAEFYRPHDVSPGR